MTISLAENLFANTNTAVGKSAAAKKTQSDGQTEDKSAPFAFGTPTDSQTSVQQKSVDDAVNDFSKTLAKKTNLKQTSGKTQNDETANQELNTKNTDASVNVQELTAIPGVQNINSQTNTNITPTEQNILTNAPVQMVSDSAQTPVISETIPQTDVQEVIPTAAEQTEPVEQPLNKIISENPQTTQTAAAQTDKNIIKTVSALDENQTNTPAQEQITENTEQQQQQFTGEETAFHEENITAEIKIPDVKIPTPAAENKNSQAIELQTNLKEHRIDNGTDNIDIDANADTDVDINVEADTTLKDILREIQNSIPNTAQNSTTVSELAENAQFNAAGSSANTIEQNIRQTVNSFDTEKSDANNNDDSGLTALQSLFKNDIQISKTTPAAQVQNLKHTDSTAGIAQQIQYNIQSSLNANSNEIVIQLNPPELGRVEVKFTEDSKGLTGILSVDKPLTKYEIQQALPEIINNLKEGGVDIKKIEVVLANQQEQQTMQDNHSAGQNNESWQQNSANQQNHAGTNIYSQWTFKDADNYSRYSSPDMHYSKDSVNMLV